MKKYAKKYSSLGDQIAESDDNQAPATDPGCKSGRYANTKNTRSHLYKPRKNKDKDDDNPDQAKKGLSRSTIVAYFKGEEKEHTGGKREDDVVIDMLFQRLSLIENHPDNPINKKLYDEVLLALLDCFQRRLFACIKRYERLSNIYGRDDLGNDCFLGLINALTKYDSLRIKDVKFSSFLDWYIRKEFQSQVNSKDNVYDVYTPDGLFYETMEYSKFIKNKKRFDKEHYTYSSRSRLLYIEDMATEPGYAGQSVIEDIYTDLAEHSSAKEKDDHAEH